ncbi:MAG: aminotransferase class I/II-fold pyridoxal phosphate-dependent enzyme, partial [Odoribacter sp.]|nr:aminotransferase class I/II-fold pyridoxal phosphate-dependent enzyme [Odoribacter sp.]
LIKSLMEILKGNIGITYPTFEEYSNRRHPDSIVAFTPNNPDFSYSAKDLTEWFSDKNIKHLLLVNPDNPSGNLIPQEDLFQLCEWTGKRNITLVLDESFVDFSKESVKNSLLRNDILKRYKHLVVVKSISKSYGVPGLRLGIMASSDTRLIEQIKKDVAIWNINSFAEFYMQIYGKYESAYSAACQEFIKERERFKTALETIPWLRVIPSEANYFLCEITEKYNSTELTEKLLTQDILIKDCAPKQGFKGKNYIRIAIRDSKDNDLFIQALKKI